MSRESILIILGVLTAIAPWSGLPLPILTWVLPVLGIAIAFIGFTLRARSNRGTAPIVKEASSRPTEELY